MKYRELSPSEIEAYQVGYKVGNRQIIITDIEWESEDEHKIYRKGYMAGLMDFKRNVSNVSNVSKVNNVDIATPTTPISISNSISNKGIDNKGGVGEKEEREIPAQQKADNAAKAQQIINNTAKVLARNPDQVVITRDSVILNRKLAQFLRTNFGQDNVQKARDWLLDHAFGTTWNTNRIIKLMCKWTGKNTAAETAKYLEYCGNR